MIIKVKKELTSYDRRVLADRSTRQQLDRLSGLSSSKGAQFGDFKHAREVAKQYQDYNRFKSKSDREKIVGNIKEIETKQNNKAIKERNGG